MAVGSMANFAYIVACPTTQQAIVIDPAAEPDRIAREIEAHRYRLVAIVNTHGHADHVGGDAALKRATGAPLIAHRDAGVGKPGLLDRAFLLMLGGEQPPAPDRLVADGDTIEVGEIELQVIHAPGHSPGDILLYAPGLVFTGDTLFVSGVGRTDLPGGSYRQFTQSLRDKVAVLPDDTVVYPGHDYGPRPTSTIGAEKRNNPELRHAVATR
ncbi:MAG: MBL fold metallo-hydrolase [Deltaproteobacteria bacterium]|nr:MBL fold metallo-hydrolase [Deltaproteobacteria bacterium]